MQKSAFLILFALLIIACGSEKENPAPKKEETKEVVSNSTKPKAKPALDGKKIYKLNCVICHGIDGSMGSSGAFDLTVTKLTLEEKIAVIRDGRNTMQPFKDILSEEKIKAVAEYIGELKVD